MRLSCGNTLKWAGEPAPFGCGSKYGGSGATCRRGLSRNVVESADVPEVAADRVCGALTRVTPCPPDGEAGEAREAGPGVVRR
jgi:hypothetical protein